MSIAAWFKRFRSTASDKPVQRTDDPSSAYWLGPEGKLNVSYGASFEPLVLVKREHTFPEDRAAAAGIFSHELTRDLELLNPYLTPPKPAPQHPLAPEKDPPPLDWERWSTMQRENFRRGWSFARFAVKSPPPDSRMACLFGIVRGAWGIAVMDFHICGTGKSGPLHAITHLPSGMGCGLFVDQESAAQACDIASRLGDDWEASVDPTQPGADEAVARLHQAWAAAGIIKCVTHAHVTADQESPPLSIWFQDYTTIIAERPEGKLS